MNALTPTLTAALHDADTLSGFTVHINRPLTDEEISRVAGALGYGLSTMKGEPLSDADCTVTSSGTTLTFEYDSTKCRRTSQSVQEALILGAQYAQEGSPQRTTDRTGPIGSRLVDGIGPAQITIDLPRADQDDVSLSPALPVASAGDAQVALAEVEAAALALAAAHTRYAAATQRYAHVIQTQPSLSDNHAPRGHGQG